MFKRIGSSVIAMIFVLSFLLALVHADIYYYVDENGVWHFTNVRNDPRCKVYLEVPDKETERYIKEYDQIIRDAARRFGVSVCLVKAIIRAESGFNERAVSCMGALGLMQLMPYTAMQMNVSDPLDPEENIMGGTRYLKVLLNRFQSVPLAVAAYNAGPKNVEIFNGIPPFPETRAFVRRVMRYYKSCRNGTNK